MEGYTPAEVIERFNKIKGERSNFDNYWEKVGHYCFPEKAFVISAPVEGEELPIDIYDTTAMRSAGFLAAGLQGHLTSPAQKWFSLTTPNKSLMDSQEVKEYFRDAEDKIYNALAASNFNHQIHEAYLDLVVFGTCALYEEEDPLDLLRFDARPIREIYFTEDALGKVDTIFRLYTLTAEQAVKLYGAGAGAEAHDKVAKKQPDTPIEYLHCVGTRHARDVSKKDAANMPFYSKIISMKDKSLVKESGYDELPFFVARWQKNSFNRYGYSPAMHAYGDIKTANEIKADLLKAAGKVVDPPVDAPHEGYLLPLDMNKGGINYRNIIDPNERIQMLNIQPNIPVGEEMLKGERENIEQHFFVDLFVMIERANMTATEVITRNEEKMILLGPVLGRLQNELLDLVIKRTFAILRRRNVIPLPPEVLIKNPDYEIRYEGKLAKMQRYSESSSIAGWLNMVGAIAKFSPQVLDWVDDEPIVRDLQEVYGVNPKFLRRPEVVEQIRKDRAEQAAAQQRMMMMKEMAAGAKDAGAASRDFSMSGAMQ